MGDSANVHVGPRRLSKPRTIKSSSNLLSEQPSSPSSRHNSIDPDCFGKDAVVVNSHGERRSRSKSRNRIRAYLYGSSHDVSQTSSDDEETQTAITGAARDVRNRLSRTGSSISPLQSTKASATRLSNSSSSGLLSIRSTESQAMDHEESAMIADQIKQRAYHDSLAAQNHVSMPVDEDRHVDSIMAPLRRKSLYTPGIATRNACDILRKPPKPPRDHDYYHDPSRPEASPLSHVAALKVGEDGRSTPTDLHYSQLGGLQLGTLRVTNGASSPAPADHPSDVACRSATPESKTMDEYYTASEGSVTGDRNHATTLPSRGASPLGNESQIEASMRIDNQVSSSSDNLSPFHGVSSNRSFPLSGKKVDQAERSERELSDESIHYRRATHNDIIWSENGTRRESFDTCPAETSNPKDFLPLERETPNKPFPPKTETRDELRFEGRNLRKSLPCKPRPSRGCSVEGATTDKCFRFGVDSPNGAANLAHVYIADLDTTPSSYPSLEDKRHTPPRSRSGTEEMRTASITDADMQHAGNGAGSREDALQKLTVNANLPLSSRPERLSAPSPRTSKYGASSEMMQADGHNSYASSREAPAYKVGFEIEETSIPSTKVSPSLSSHAVENVRSSARSSFRISLRKLQKQRPKSQPPPVNFVPVKQCHELTDVHIPRVPSIIAARHADRLRQFPLLERTSQSSQYTSADRTVSPSQPHHELIRFPSPANAFEAASAPSRTPLIASSENQASTKVVGEDARVSSDLVRSPSWSDFGGGRRRKEQKKLAKEEKQLEKRVEKDTKENNKQRTTRSRSTPRSRPSSQHDPFVTIADFGSVTESLGKGPYDIATAMSRPPNVPQNRSNWHPHQMSTALPRPKSMFGMGKAAAMGSSRARSRDRSQSFVRPGARQDLWTSTSCGNHDSQATGGDCIEDKAVDMPDTLPSSSTVKLTRSDPVSSGKSSKQVPVSATPVDFLPGMPTQRTSGEYRRELGGRIRTQSLFLDAPSVPALAAVDFRAHDIDWARTRQRSQSLSAARTEAIDNSDTFSRKPIRFSSVEMDDTPPVPALPSMQQVKKREAEITRSRPHSLIVEAREPTPTSREINYRKGIPCPEVGTSAASYKTKGSKVIPDLWSNGSLEKKSPKAVERSRQTPNVLISASDKALPVKDYPWETGGYAWSQRRKSAGEALLRNQVRDICDGREAANRTPLYENSNKRPALARASNSGVCQTITPSANHLAPFLNPLASHNPLIIQQPNYGSNTPILHHQSVAPQLRQPGISTFASRPWPSSVQHGHQIPTSPPRRAPTQSFQIPRKRVGSGPSILRTGNAIGPGHYEVTLV